MAIKYKIIPRKNPQDLTAAPKYYAKAVVTGKDSTNSLAREVAMNTTMGRADILGVLTAMGEIIEKRLAMGRSVDLLDLCILSPAISSSGVDNEADFNATSHVKKVRINIRPKKNLLEAVQKAGLERE